MNKNRIEIYNKNNQVEKVLGLDGFDCTLKTLDADQDFSYIEDCDKRYMDNGKVIKYDLKEHFKYGLNVSGLDGENTNKLITFFDLFDDLGFECSYDENRKALMYQKVYDNKSYTRVSVYSISYTDDSSFQSMTIKYKIFNSYFGFIGDMRGDNNILIRINEATKNIKSLIDDLVIYNEIISTNTETNGYKIFCDPNSRTIYCNSSNLLNFEIKYSVSKAECGGVLYNLLYIDSNGKSDVIDTFANETILNLIYAINISINKKSTIINSTNCIDYNRLLMSNDIKDIIYLAIERGCSIDFNDITDSFIINKQNKKYIIISKIHGGLHDKSANILLMDIHKHNTSLVYNRRIRYPSTKRSISNFLDVSY